MSDEIGSLSQRWSDNLFLRLCEWLGNRRWLSNSGQNGINNIKDCILTIQCEYPIYASGLRFVLQAAKVELQYGKRNRDTTALFLILEQPLPFLSLYIHHRDITQNERVEMIDTVTYAGIRVRHLRRSYQSIIG